MIGNCATLLGMKRMKKRTIALILSAFLIAAGVGAFQVWASVTGRRYIASAEVVRRFEPLQQRMQALADGVEHITLNRLGEVNYDGSAWPVLMLSRHSESPRPFRVLLLGGVHGNEPAGTQFLMDFAEALSREASAYEGITFDIIPVMNPWGWAHGRRRNGAYIDLNRDFNSFKAQESLLLRELCKNTEYDLMVDFHEDGQVSGFYFYRLAHPDDALCRALIVRVRDAGQPVHHGRVSRIFHAEDGIINCALWSLKLARCIRQLSVSNYFRLQGTPQAFLFETPRRLPLESRVAMHREALTALLEKNQPQEAP